MADPETDGRRQEPGARRAGDDGSVDRQGKEADLLRLNEHLDRYRAELAARNEHLEQVGRKLEASRNEFLDLFESAPVGYVTLTARGLVEKANARARQALGLADRATGGLAFDNYVWAEDREAYLRRLAAVRKGRRPHPFELRLRGVGGDLFVQLQIAPRFDPEGGLDHLQLAFFDITEQKRLQKQLQDHQEDLLLATEAGGIGIWSYDLVSRKTRWNEQLYRLLGLAPREGPEEDDAFFAFIHPEDRQGALRNIRSVVAQGDAFEMEFRIVRARDGGVRWLAGRGRVERDAAGRPIGMRGVNWDITERKRTRETTAEQRRMLADKVRELERINEELSEYAYAVSHDLKAPLRAVRNYVDFLVEDLEGQLGPEPLQYVQGLKKAVTQGEEMIRDLLEFSRLGQVCEEGEPIDLQSLVREVCDSLPEGVPGGQVALRRDCPHRLTAPRALIKAILSNLISNGLKFNRSEVPQVDVWCRPFPDERVELVVRDNGIGIEERYRAQIFRVFQRLHTAGAYPGTGIGLAIVRKAVARMGGTVHLESVPGQGSTITVRLPRGGDSQ